MGSQRTNPQCDPRTVLHYISFFWLRVQNSAPWLLRKDYRQNALQIGGSGCLREIPAKNVAGISSRYDTAVSWIILHYNQILPYT